MNPDTAATIPVWSGQEINRMAVVGVVGFGELIERRKQGWGDFAKIGNLMAIGRKAMGGRAPEIEAAPAGLRGAAT